MSGKRSEYQVGQNMPPMHSKCDSSTATGQTQLSVLSVHSFMKNEEQGSKRQVSEHEHTKNQFKVQNRLEEATETSFVRRNARQTSRFSITAVLLTFHVFCVEEKYVGKSL